MSYLLPEDFVRSNAELSRAWSEPESLQYTRWLSTHHYENFHVVSFLLPKRLHQDFYNVYAFCRWSDDLGDEIGDTAESLRLLTWWRDLLDRMYAGEAWHPVYVALRETVARHQLPRELFSDLIHAFMQDQTVTRYETWDGVIDYCRYSANPVGRLVLALCGYHDDERQRLSDFTCTALQLANHWQDVAVDLENDRVYIPAEIMREHGYGYEDLIARREDDRFRGVMREVVARARELFRQGLPLIGTVDRRLSLDLDLFSRGGIRVLDKIEAQNYGVLARRPYIGKAERIGILLGSLYRTFVARVA